MKSLNSKAAAGRGRGRGQIRLSSDSAEHSTNFAQHSLGSSDDGWNA